MRSLRHIRADAEGWRACDIVLPDGEIGIERHEGRVRLKVGDGIHPFTALPYIDGAVRTESDILRTGDDLRLGECESLSLSLPATPEEDFYALVTFDSGPTPTRIKVSGKVYFSGDDCALGTFSPAAHRHYTLMIWYDGTLQGLVRGVSRG